MKLYFAGYFGIELSELKNLVKYKLYSFATEKKEAVRFGSQGLLLDSGAFTEFTTGKPINIYDLIKFIEDFKPENAIQLDKIGDEDASWERFKIMDTRVKVLPVIHYNASVRHIKRVLNLENDYICLGGLVPFSKSYNRHKLIKWCDYLYSNFPQIRIKRVHCLGIMNKEVLSRYPFYSADSSSATSIFRYPGRTKTKQVEQKIYKKDRLRLITPEIKKQLQLEKYLTKLWESRGVKWHF